MASATFHENPSTFHENPSPLIRLPEMTVKAPAAREQAKPVALQGADLKRCPECECGVAIAHGSEEDIISCPACGQCLAAPSPWTTGLTDWGRPRPNWPFANDRKSGSVGIIAGCLFAAVWWTPLAVSLKLAGIFLGGTVAVEGLARLWAARQARQQIRVARRLHLPMPTPPTGCGALKAVFKTKNSWFESIAITLLGLATAWAGFWLLDWLLRGIVNIKVVAAPAVVIWLLYRSIRNMLDRKTLMVFSNGFACLSSDVVHVHTWQEIECIDANKTGDAIDEHAVLISFRDGRAPLKYTRCQFANLELLWQRLSQECKQACNRT